MKETRTFVPDSVSGGFKVNLAVGGEDDFGSLRGSLHSYLGFKGGPT